MLSLTIDRFDAKHVFHAPRNFSQASRQLSLNRFFDPSTPSMRKGRDGETEKKRGKKEEKKRKIRMKIVATTSLPAVDRPNADRWNAARSRQNVCQKNGSNYFRE